METMTLELPSVLVQGKNKEIISFPTPDMAEDWLSQHSNAENFTVLCRERSVALSENTHRRIMGIVENDGREQIFLFRDAEEGKRRLSAFKDKVTKLIDLDKDEAEADGVSS